ncbi:hypothetical protein HRbin16_03015 [bacterium HR16]|nr:hypothetical protein HRbin16_03015 [bacterium HR16]
MKTSLVLEIPESLKAALESAGYSSADLSQEALRQLAVSLYRRKVLTLSQSAHLAHMSLWEFIPYLAQQGIDIVDYEPEELEHDLRAIAWSTKSREQL